MKNIFERISESTGINSYSVFVQRILACSLILNTSSLGFNNPCPKRRLSQCSMLLYGNWEKSIMSGRDLALISLCLKYPPEKWCEYHSLFQKHKGSLFPCKTREILWKWLSMLHILGYHLVAPTWLTMDVTNLQSIPEFGYHDSEMKFMSLVTDLFSVYRKWPKITAVTYWKEIGQIFTDIR